MQCFNYRSLDGGMDVKRITFAYSVTFVKINLSFILQVDSAGTAWAGGRNTWLVGLSGKCFHLEIISHYEEKGREEEIGLHGENRRRPAMRTGVTHSVSRRDLNPGSHSLTAVVTSVLALCYPLLTSILGDETTQRPHIFHFWRGVCHNESWIR